MKKFALLTGEYSPSQELWGIIGEVDTLRRKLAQIVELDNTLNYDKSFFQAMIALGDASDYVRKLRPRASRDKISEFEKFKEDFAS